MMKDKRNCKKSCPWKKILACIAVLAAAAAVLYRIYQWLEGRKDEIDTYLMENPDEDQAFFVHTGDDNLIGDIEEWKELAGSDRISLSFLADPAKAKAFQETVAKAGCSSTYDDEFHILDVILSGPMDHKELSETAEKISAASKEADAVYEGFAFE